jgi:hypothetical protein
MINETKQSSIDWIFEQLFINPTLNLREIKEKAKEMENKIMMQCYSDGLGNGIAVGRGEISFESVADEKEYLIRTYGGNK